MPIPDGENAFTWLQRQVHDLQVDANKLKVFYTEWASLTNAQKNGLKLQVSNRIDSVIAELGDIKTAITGL